MDQSFVFFVRETAGGKLYIAAVRGIERLLVTQLNRQIVGLCSKGDFMATSRDDVKDTCRVQSDRTKCAFSRYDAIPV